VNEKPARLDSSLAVIPVAEGAIRRPSEGHPKEIRRRFRRKGGYLLGLGHKLKKNRRAFDFCKAKREKREVDHKCTTNVSILASISG
jgi:hypothetical protein